MTPIIALYEPAEGTPGYFLLFVMLLFVIAWMLPFVVRCVALRRPVVNLWAAIPLAVVCGFFIAVSTNMLLPKMPGNAQIYLLAVACVYSYCIMHIGHKKYCIQKIVGNERKDKPKDEQKQ